MRLRKTDGTQHTHVIDIRDDTELKRSVERRLRALEIAVRLIEIRKGPWKPKPQQ